MSRLARAVVACVAANYRGTKTESICTRQIADARRAAFSTLLAEDYCADPPRGISKARGIGLVVSLWGFGRLLGHPGRTARLG